MRKAAYVALLAQVIICSWSFAAETGHRSRAVTILGTRSCESWNKNLAAERAVGDGIGNWIAAAGDRSWAVGVISGMNMAADIDVNALSDVNSQLVFDWIEQYCINNPKNDVMDGVSALFLKLVKAKKK